MILIDEPPAGGLEFPTARPAEHGGNWFTTGLAPARVCPYRAHKKKLRQDGPSRSFIEQSLCTQRPGKIFVNPMDCASRRSTAEKSLETIDLVGSKDPLLLDTGKHRS